MNQDSDCSPALALAGSMAVCNKGTKGAQGHLQQCLYTAARQATMEVVRCSRCAALGTQRKQTECACMCVRARVKQFQSLFPKDMKIQWQQVELQHLQLILDVVSQFEQLFLSLCLTF